MIVVVDLSCGRRSNTHSPSTPPRFVKSGCSAYESFLDELVFACPIARSRASSTAPLRVQVDIRVRERELLGLHGVSRHRSGRVRTDSSRARAPLPR